MVSVESLLDTEDTPVVSAAILPLSFWIAESMESEALMVPAPLTYPVNAFPVTVVADIEVLMDVAPVPVTSPDNVTVWLPVR